MMRRFFEWASYRLWLLSVPVAEPSAPTKEDEPVDEFDLTRTGW